MMFSIEELLELGVPGVIVHVFQGELESIRFENKEEAIEHVKKQVVFFG